MRLLDVPRSHLQAVHGTEQCDRLLRQEPRAGAHFRGPIKRVGRVLSRFGTMIEKSVGTGSNETCARTPRSCSTAPVNVRVRPSLGGPHQQGHCTVSSAAARPSVRIEEGFASTYHACEGREPIASLRYFKESLQEICDNPLPEGYR